MYDGGAAVERLEDDSLAGDLEGENFKKTKDNQRKRVSLEKIVQMSDVAVMDSLRFLHETIRNNKANLNARVVCANSIVNVNLKAKKQLEEAKMADQMYRHKELVIQVEAEKLAQLRGAGGDGSGGYASDQQGRLQMDYIPNPAYENVPTDPSLAEDYVPDADDGLGGDAYK